MKKHGNHSNKIYKIDGVGVNLDRFYPVKSSEEKINLRIQKGFCKDDFILLCVAEFIPRKNHKLIFNILPELQKSIPNLKLIFCGKGELLEYYKNCTKKNGFSKIVFFTGYTKEVDLYCKIADCLIAPSFQEGLALNLVEAMACGISIVATNIRGHNDVINDLENGFLCDINDENGFIKSIILLYKNPLLRKQISERNVIEAKKYSVDIAVNHMSDIYKSIMQSVSRGGTKI